MGQNKLPTKTKIVVWGMCILGIGTTIYGIGYFIIVLYASFFKYAHAANFLPPFLIFLFGCFLLFLGIQIIRRRKRWAWQTSIGILITLFLLLVFWGLYNVFINIQAKYYLEAALKTKNIDKCLQIVGWFHRDDCIKTLAITEKNESFCELIKSTIKRNCLVELAKIKKDPKICKDLEKEGGIGLVYDCYKEIQAFELDENADWKTYISPELGIFIKYPANWEAISDIPESGMKSVSFQTTNKTGLSIIKGAKFYSPEWVEFTFEERVDYQRESKSTQGRTEAEEKQITLDGRPATLISYTECTMRRISSQEEWLPECSRTTHVYETTQKIWIHIVIYQYDEAKKSEYSPIFNQILSTFRFLE